MSERSCVQMCGKSSVRSGHLRVEMMAGAHAHPSLRQASLLKFHNLIYCIWCLKVSFLNIPFIYLSVTYKSSAIYYSLVSSCEFQELS